MKVFTEHSPESENINASTEVSREDLLKVPEPRVSEQSMRANIGVSLRYLESWLGGVGCVAINNLMEDTATVEICRAQIWQWIHHSIRLLEGPAITRELFRSMLREETARVMNEIGSRAYHLSKYKDAGDLLDKLTTSQNFPEFMTLLAYDRLE
jgi:malate synthase